MSRDALVAAATRTPIGRARKGAFADVRPDDLAAAAIRAAVALVPALDSAEIDDVVLGCAIPERAQGLNIARRAALLAGLPVSVPGTTVNRFCASSLEAIRMGTHAIVAGEADVVVAGGVESVSFVPGPAGGPEDLHPLLSGGPGSIVDAYIAMGQTAENVADLYGVDRSAMDRFAQRSQERAVKAQDEGFFAREITSYALPDGTLVNHDEGPRRDSTLERLEQLEPAFRAGGSVTAGNACPLNDGAAAVVLVSEAAAKRLDVAPRARLLASAVAANEPELMGVAPIGAIRAVLRRAGMTIDDVDVVELNEAFAAQVLPICDAVGIDPFGENLNPHGGAIALGHPYGMTGARMLCTLLNGLESRDGTVGLETMCVAGGQGVAMLVERL